MKSIYDKRIDIKDAMIDISIEERLLLWDWKLNVYYNYEI